MNSDRWIDATAKGWNLSSAEKRQMVTWYKLMREHGVEYSTATAIAVDWASFQPVRWIAESLIELMETATIEMKEWWKRHG
jgi:hypothetical protein